MAVMAIILREVLYVVQFYPWFKFIFFCFILIIMSLSYITIPKKQKKTKFNSRIKLNHNIILYTYHFFTCRDLYGAIGFPLRVAKTVVVGKDSKLVEQVLTILSYFIRCSEVFEHVQKRDVGSKDGANDSGSNLKEENSCSYCGHLPPADKQRSNKSSSLTSEAEVCFKCKQNCGGKCLLQELKDGQDQKSLCEQTSEQSHINVQSSKCYCSECSGKSNSLNALSEIELSQLKCVCNSISIGGVQKELKHFVKVGNHLKSFRCYCCEHQNRSNVNDILAHETKEKCFCDSGCDAGNNEEKQDFTRQLHSTGSYCINCLQNGSLTKLSHILQRKDVVLGSNGHNDSRISETGSCLSSDDTADIVSVRSSDVQETIESYGRSGSADSGIHQSPLNSPIAQRPVDFPKLIAHQGEEAKMPKELSLPPVLDVNCCPDLNR